MIGKKPSRQCKIAKVRETKSRVKWEHDSKKVTKRNKWRWAILGEHASFSFVRAEIRHAVARLLLKVAQLVHEMLAISTRVLVLRVEPVL